MSTARRCSSLVGRAELVLPMWRAPRKRLGPSARRAGAPAVDGAGRCTSVCRSTRGAPASRIEELDAYLVAADRHVHRRGRRRPTDGRRRAWLPTPRRGPDHGGPRLGPLRARQVVFKAEVGSQSPAVGQIQGVWVHPDWRGRGLGAAGTATLAGAVVRQRPHRQPVRQRLQHRRAGDLRADRLQPGGHLRDRAARLSEAPSRRPTHRSPPNNVPISVRLRRGCAATTHNISPNGITNLIRITGHSAC